MDWQEMNEKGEISKPDLLLLSPLSDHKACVVEASLLFLLLFFPFKDTHAFTC